MATTREATNDPLLTIKALARLEGMTEDRVRHLIRTAGLPCYRVAGVRIRWSEYQAWLAARKVQ